MVDQWRRNQYCAQRRAVESVSVPLKSLVILQTRGRFRFNWVWRYKVICTCYRSFPGVPRFFEKAKAKVWITARNTACCPRSTHSRNGPREAARGKQSGRTVRIQRFDWSFFARGGWLKNSVKTDLQSTVMSFKPMAVLVRRLITGGFCCFGRMRCAF